MFVVWLLTAVLVGCRPPNAGADAQPVKLTIAAINDFHGALYEKDHGDDGMVVGGLPWFMGALDHLRDEDPDLVVLDGGDLFQGTWPVNATKGRGSVEAFNLMRVDAAAVGNHEFDYGPAGMASHPLRGALRDAAHLAGFHWLTANVSIVADDVPSPWAPPGIEPYALIERKGVTIGVIGLTTTETPQTTLARNVVDLRFNDPVETVRALVPQLRASGADVIAVVGHLTGACDPASYFEVGEPCLPDGEIGRLLTELPRGTIDVMVVGHAHTLMAHRWEDTFLLENRSMGHAIGVLDLVVGPTGVDRDASAVRQPWALVHEPSEPGCGGGGYDADPQMLGGVAEITPSLDAISLVRALEGDVGSLCDPVACTEHRVLRSATEESPIGNIVADAMRDAFKGAELAITNSGGLRSDFPKGTVRREHVHEVMPFDNRLLLLEMSGEQLQRVFRLGSSGAHGILQVSGGGYAFDPTSTTGSDIDGDGEVDIWERDRLCSVEIIGAALDPQRTYRVVTTDFLFEGGDHLGPGFEGVEVQDTGPLLREQIVTWLERQSSCLDSEPLVSEEWPRVSHVPCKAAPPEGEGEEAEGLLSPDAAEDL